MFRITFSNSLSRGRDSDGRAFLVSSLSPGEGVAKGSHGICRSAACSAKTPDSRTVPDSSRCEQHSYKGFYDTLLVGEGQGEGEGYGSRAG